METDALTPAEHQLAEIWAEVLGLEKIERDQDFFAIGGDSLLATKVVLRVRRAWEADFTVRVLLEIPVLKDLAQHIDEVMGERESRPETAAGSPEATPA